MSPFGHIMDANNRAKDNRAMLMSRRKRMAKMRLMYAESTARREAPSRTPIPPDVLKHIKDNIRQEMQLERRRQVRKLVLISILSVAVTIVLVLLIKWLILYLIRL